MNFKKIINLDFSKETEPKDDRLMTLLGQAYRAEIDCTMAVARISSIKPFSRFRPTVSEEYRKYFIENNNSGRPPALHVYAKNGKLMMSDDYHAYTMYLESGMSEALCIVIGETPVLNGVEYHGEPFKIQPPILVDISPPKPNSHHRNPHEATLCP
jgi:hypothetical protein